MLILFTFTPYSYAIGNMTIKSLNHLEYVDKVFKFFCNSFKVFYYVQRLGTLEIL